MPDWFRVRCDAVKYRQGFIEVVGQIHPGLVNVETWQVSVDADTTGLYPDSDGLTDDDLIANTELELTPAQARSLAAALVAAADAAESRLERPNGSAWGPRG
jgi:hypothetical protein